MRDCPYCKGTQEQKDKDGKVVSCPGCKGTGYKTKPVEVVKHL